MQHVKVLAGCCFLPLPALGHRWMHENKTVFNLTHRKHHSQQAALDATTSGYMALTEGVLSGAIPVAISYALGLATGNWWYTLAGGWDHLLTWKGIRDLSESFAGQRALCH